MAPAGDATPADGSVDGLAGDPLVEPADVGLDLSADAVAEAGPFEAGVAEHPAIAIPARMTAGRRNRFRGFTLVLPDGQGPTRTLHRERPESEGQTAGIER